MQVQILPPLLATIDHIGIGGLMAVYLKQSKMNHCEHNKMTHGKSSFIEYIKFGLIIAGIIIASYLLYASGETGGIPEYMRWLMGVFMATFAAFKFIGYKMFVATFAGYDIVAQRFSLYGKLFPLIEMSLALLYLLNVLPVGRNILVAVVTGTAAIGVFREIYQRKTGIHCACLGNVIKLPLSTVSLIENVSMFAMATAMLMI